MEKPCQKHNLVIYFEDGKSLLRQRKQPIFHENVYIYSEDNYYLYAYDAAKFGDDDYSTFGVLTKVVDVCFKYNGIHISGLELPKDEFRFEVAHYQKWLITSLSREQLEKENWYY